MLLHYVAFLLYPEYGNKVEQTTFFGIQTINFWGRRHRTTEHSTTRCVHYIETIVIVVVIVFYKSCSQVTWHNAEFTNISITCSLLQVRIILCAKCSQCVILLSRSRLTTMPWRSVMPFFLLHLPRSLIGPFICIDARFHIWKHARAFSLAVSHTARVTYCWAVCKDD